MRRTLSIFIFCCLPLFVVAAVNIKLSFRPVKNLSTQLEKARHLNCEDVQPFENLKKWIDVIAPVVTICSGLLGLLVETKKEKEEKIKGKIHKVKNLTVWAWVSMLGIIIGGCLSVWGVFNNYGIEKLKGCALEKEKTVFSLQKAIQDSTNASNSKEIKENGHKLSSDLLTAIGFQEKIIELQQKINEITNKNFGKAEELSRQYRKNAELQKDLNNYVTGGDTKPTVLIYCFKRPFAVIGEGYAIYVDIANQGKYPLQNVICTVNDISCAETQRYVREIRTLGGWSGNRQALKPGENPEVEYNTNIGSLSPNTRLPIFTGVYSFQYSKLEPGFTVKVRWNNGDVIYFFHGKITKDKLHDDGTSEMVFNGKKMQMVNLQIE